MTFFGFSVGVTYVIMSGYFCGVQRHGPTICRGVRYLLRPLFLGGFFVYLP